MLGLLRELDVHPGDVVQVPGLLDLKSLWQIYAVDRPGAQGATVRAGHPSGVHRPRDHLRHPA